MGKADPIAEICHIEASDDLHEYGGGHGNKGNDFCRYWLIGELINLEKNKEKNYVFILEYVQDIARFDEQASPKTVVFYQLKKKEGAKWNLSNLAGLPKTKAGKVDEKTPLFKLFKAVLACKELKPSAEFVSNARYDVPLATGENSVVLECIALNELSAEKCEVIAKSVSDSVGVHLSQVPMDGVRLRYAPIEVNDMRNQLIGITHGFLKDISPSHAAQADTFVDGLFAKLSTASRHTSKCKTWEELLARRGFDKPRFGKALEELQKIPDRQRFQSDCLIN